MGYCPWGHKESDTTEQFSRHTLMTQFPFLYCRDSLGSSDINPTQQRSSVSLFICVCFFSALLSPSPYFFFVSAFLCFVTLDRFFSMWLKSWMLVTPGCYLFMSIVHNPQSKDTSPSLVENYWSGL